MTSTATMTSALLGTVLSSSVRTLGVQVIMAANEVRRIPERPASTGGGPCSPSCLEEEVYSEIGLPVLGYVGSSQRLAVK